MTKSKGNEEYIHIILLIQFYNVIDLENDILYILRNMHHITQSQIIQGTTLLVIYIIVKTVVSQYYTLYNGFGSELSVEAAAIIGGMFLFCTVLLVYGGFSFWLRIPLGLWISTRRRIIGDIVWGFAGGILIVVINIICLGGFIVFELIPSQQDEQVISVVSYSLTLLFRFLVIAPCEEVLFRGFLQQVYRQWFGPVSGVFLQAVFYAVLYLGFYPLELWFFILLPFLHGIVWGALREMRGTLVSPLLGHSVAG